MRVRVIEPPQPIVTPVDIPGSHAANDAAIKAMIAAAQADIDGPTGWLNRSLGVQTLEVEYPWLDARTIRLPFAPIIEVVSAAAHGVAIENENWAVDFDRVAWPDAASTSSVRIRYRSGYDGRPVDEGGTGAVDERARHAIILTVKNLVDMGKKDLFETQESVVGIGSKARSVTPYVAEAVTKTVQALLQGLRIYA